MLCVNKILYFQVFFSGLKKELHLIFVFTFLFEIELNSFKTNKLCLSNYFKLSCNSKKNVVVILNIIPWLND